MIAASIPELDMARAQRVVVQRDSSFFKQPSDAMQAVGGPAADTRWVSTTSDFFEVRGRLRLDDVALEEVSVVQRDRRTRQVTTLWRERTALTVDLGNGAGATPLARAAGAR